MAEKKLNLVIKQANVKSANISIEANKTIQDLRKAICEEFKVQESLVKLVFKGKFLNINESLEEAGIQNGSIIYLTLLSKNDAAIQQQNPIPQNLSSGGFGLMNQMGFSDRGVDQNQSNQLQQLFNSPFYQNMMQQMFSNPQFMRQMAQNDPFLSQLIESRPEILDQMQSPAFQQMLNDPQILSQAAGMMGRTNSNAMGTMSGNSGSLPQPGSKVVIFLCNLGVNQQQASEQSEKNKQQTQQQQSQQMPIPGGFAQPNLMQMLTQLRGQMSQQPQQSSQQQQQQFPFQFNPFLAFQNQMMPNQFNQQQQQQQPQANENLEEKYAKQIKQLEDMGFTEKQANLDALKTAQGNVDIAIERLLSKQ